MRLSLAQGEWRLAEAVPSALRNEHHHDRDDHARENTLNAQALRVLHEGACTLTRRGIRSGSCRFRRR